MAKNWYQRVWPWSRFPARKAEREQTRLTLLAAIRELDPYYIERQLWGIQNRPPRAQCLITGTVTPAGY